MNGGRGEMATSGHEKMQGKRKMLNSDLRSFATLISDITIPPRIFSVKILHYSCMLLKLKCVLFFKYDDMQKKALRQELNSSWKPRNRKVIKRSLSVISVFK